MRPEPGIADAGEKVVQHRKRQIARQPTHAADYKIAVGRTPVADRLGDQSMG